MKSLTLLAVIMAAIMATPAVAVDVASGSVTLSLASPRQLGRLSRNNIQQDWSGTEAFPGTVNPGVAYAYTSIAIPFAANGGQDVYYDISFDDAASDLFASAYLDTYDPANKALNWLGDAGNSGNYFPNDARYFDVVVPAGHSLRLVVNSTVGTAATSTADYFISAFSDTEYSEDFAPAIAAVPEPATWALMLGGFGLAGMTLRRRRTALA